MTGASREYLRLIRPWLACCTVCAGAVHARAVPAGRAGLAVSCGPASGLEHIGWGPAGGGAGGVSRA